MSEQEVKNNNKNTKEGNSTSPSNSDSRGSDSRGSDSRGSGYRGNRDRRNDRRRERKPEPEVIWTPRTRLGTLVQSGSVQSLDTIFQNGWKIKEYEIVNKLLPDIKSFVVHVGVVQKQTDAGESTRFKSVVAVGDENGWFGIGTGKKPQMKNAIDSATQNALLNIIPVKLGCGSWECRCGTNHSIPHRTVGRGGSVKIELIPGPKGLGLVAGETIRNLLALAGVKDVWSKSFGSTSTMPSVANAVYDSIRQLHGMSLQ